MKKLTLFILGGACTLMSCNAQPSHRKDIEKPLSGITPLSIGDKVPDLVFHQMLNYKDSIARLSDFKGKLVILDFWSTLCGSCLATFPKLDSLQQKFGDRIQIILVNTGRWKHDGEQEVQQTLKRLEVRTGFYPSMPISILDTALDSYFPHKSVPHEVWIDDNGEIIATTLASEVNTAHIRTVLSGGRPAFTLKKDFSYDRAVPLLVKGHGGEEGEMVFRSLITAYRPDISAGGGWRKNDAGKVVGFFQINSPLISLIHLAYPRIFDSASYRTSFDVMDTLRYSIKPGKRNLYCYDLIVPPTAFKDMNLRRYLQDDLEKAFDIHVKIQPKEIFCWLASVNANDMKSWYTKYSKPSIDVREANIRKYMHGCTLSKVIKVFSNQLGVPIVNNAKINPRIDIDFPEYFNWTDRESAISLMKEVGIRLDEGSRAFNFAVVSDK